MGFYNDRILPHVINLLMRNRDLRPYRERVISRAQGRVLATRQASCSVQAKNVRTSICRGNHRR